MIGKHCCQRARVTPTHSSANSHTLASIGSAEVGGRWRHRRGLRAPFAAGGARPISNQLKQGVPHSWQQLHPEMPLQALVHDEHWFPGLEEVDPGWHQRP
jgi:hypothetical protein